jgi:hypothetical protein
MDELKKGSACKGHRSALVVIESFRKIFLWTESRCRSIHHWAAVLFVIQAARLTVCYNMLMKTLRIILLVLIIIGLFLIFTQKSWVPKLVSMILEMENTHITTVSGFKDVAFTVDGQSMTLVNGRSESSAGPGSVSKVITLYFGNGSVGDLNSDGAADRAFLITQTRGGSGTFYYVVVALKTKTGYQGTNAVFLGDRIAPQTTEIRDEQLIVNYVDRATGEPMTARPSMGVSKYLKVKGSVLEVVR